MSSERKVGIAMIIVKTILVVCVVSLIVILSIVLENWVFGFWVTVITGFILIVKKGLKYE